MKPAKQIISEQLRTSTDCPVDVFKHKFTREDLIVFAQYCIDKNHMPSLLAAGKLALAARLVTTANAKNLSERIIQMENALDIYDNEIIGNQ